ncbi:hypothetical protein K9M78_05180 [Candidatus Bipolaricaulota bacterium]|nr:hypothetical protein [Candidatus Bipolaricaulota bacterium]
MSKKSVLYTGVLLIVALLLIANPATGQNIGDKLSRTIKQRLNLDSEVYRVVETEYQGEKVVLIVIYGNGEAQNSKLGSDIKSGLKRHEGESPVAISVLTRNREASFQPYALRIIQNGETLQASQIFGITDGFKEGKVPEKVPIEGKVFWGSKGIITLGSSFDPTTPFKIKYGTTSAKFALDSSLQQEEQKPAEVSQNNEETQMEGYEDSESSERKDEGSSRASSSRKKTGQGLTLAFWGGVLTVISFSLLGL